MKAIVLCLAGGIGSGKTEIASRLAARLAWPWVSFGNYVRTVATDRGLPETREHLQALGAELIGRDLEGFCLAVLGQAHWHDGESIVVEGIRHAEALAALRKVAPTSSVVLIYLDVPEVTRAARIAARSDTSLTLTEAQEHSTEIQVKTTLRALADLVLNAEQEPDALVAAIAEWTAR